MRGGLGWWWYHTGPGAIPSPPPLAINAVHNPSPGDIFVYVARQKRQVWLWGSQDGWVSLPHDVGTLTGRIEDTNHNIAHPSEGDRYLTLPKLLNGAPVWVKWASVEKRNRRIRQQMIHGSS